MAYELGIFAIFPIALVGHLLRESSYGPEFLVAVAVIGIGLFGFPLHMPVTSFAAALALGGLARARHDLGADELQLGIFDGEGRIGAALRPRADRTAGPGAGFQPNMSAAAGYGSCPSPAFQDSGIDRMREQMRAIRAYFEQTHQIRSAP